MQRRSDSWSTQQQLVAAESRASKDLRPLGDCQGAVGGPLGMGSAERVWLLENPAGYDGWAVCVPAAVYLCVCIPVGSCVPVCVCVRVCMYIYQSECAREQSVRIWMSYGPHRQGHQPRLSDPKVELTIPHPEMTEWVSQGRNHLQSAVSM